MNARHPRGWQGFAAFWVLAALSLFILGIATLVGVAHAHRVAFALMALAVPCLTIGLLVRRAARRIP